MSSSFTVDKARFATLFTQSILYGIAVVLFIEAMGTLVWSSGSLKSASQIRWGLVVVSSAMFIVATVDCFTSFSFCYEAFVLAADKKGTEAVFENINGWHSVTLAFVGSLQALIGDLFLLYRCWSVWAGNWKVIVIPVLLVAGSAFSGFTVTYLEVTTTDDVLITVHRLNVWTNVTVILLFISNVVTTGLITLRIWLTSRTTQSYSRRQGSEERPLMFAIRVLVESGALYAATTLSLFIGSVVKTNAVYIISEAMVPIISICFNMIIIRVDRRLSGASMSSSHNQSTHNAVSMMPMRVNGQMSTPGHLQSQAVQINVTKHEDSDGDYLGDTKPKDSWGAAV